MEIRLFLSKPKAEALKQEIKDIDQTDYEFIETDNDLIQVNIKNFNNLDAQLLFDSGIRYINKK